MSDRVSNPAADLIDWKFQIEEQGFIARYGLAGGYYYKQLVLQSGVPIVSPGVKRISFRVYVLASRIASSIK